MKKILVCKECGKRFISETVVLKCNECLSKSVENGDPFELAPINIMKLVTQLELIHHPFAIVNAMKELDCVLSTAYYNGYISEEFYEDVCDEIGLQPSWESIVHYDDDFLMDYTEGRDIVHKKSRGSSKGNY